MFKQRTGKLIFKALVILPIIIVSGCGGGEGLLTGIENTPTPTIETIPLPTATLAPTMTPTPLIPDEIKTELEESFGVVEVVEKDGVSYVAAKDGRNVGVYAAESENWVVLPEASADWKIPAEAEIILDEDKNPVVFGANSRLWKYNEEGRWVTDLSEVDVWALTDWLEQVVENAQGPVEEMQFPPKHDAKGFYALNDYLIFAEGSDGFSYRVLAWFGEKVMVRESDKPDEAFILLVPVVHDRYDQPHRLLVLGFVQMNDQDFGVQLSHWDKNEKRYLQMKTPDLSMFNEIYMPFEKSQDVVVYLNYRKASVDKFNHLGFNESQIKKWYEQIFNGNIPENLPLLIEILIKLNDKAIKD